MGRIPYHLGEDHMILSQSGVQQGDPLGPLGFALTIHPIVRSRLRCHGMCIMAQRGSPAAKGGSRLWTDRGISYNTVSSEIPLASPRLGPSSFCSAVSFFKRVDNLKESVAKLPHLEDSRNETTLLSLSFLCTENLPS